MAKTESAELGMNKTGIGTAPILSKQMIESSRTGPVSAGDSITPAELRAEYIREGQVIGSVPPPTSMKGMAKSALQALKGEKATVLVDKLAERLAFERTGTRLYETLIQKAQAIKTADRSVTVQELERICREELNHFHLLWDCLERLGADPTVETPSADVSALASQGIPKVLADPRTTFGQCLEAILIAELVDNDAWERLIALAQGFNQTDMVDQFRVALNQEADHLAFVRRCLTEEINREAGTS
jgi:tRNA isopentenyl-2-thiomethyl-A-37 hydroxylase MiaE